jgi:2'-5' RNA ligase
MHRLFVAIRPPRAIRERLLSLMGGVSRARWQSDEQLHLTLRFIGDVDRHVAQDVAAALGSIHHPQFDIAGDGLGTFERRGMANAIWMGVTPQEPLRALHNKVDQACLLAGVQPDRRAYHPHITLARLGRSAGAVDALLESSGGAVTPAFTVDSFCLFESALTPEGSVYSIVERYPLS